MGAYEWERMRKASVWLSLNEKKLWGYPYIQSLFSVDFCWQGFNQQKTSWSFPSNDCKSEAKDIHILDAIGDTKAPWWKWPQAAATAEWWHLQPGMVGRTTLAYHCWTLCIHAPGGTIPKACQGPGKVGVDDAVAHHVGCQASEIHWMCFLPKIRIFLRLRSGWTIGGTEVRCPKRFGPG